MSVIQVRGTSGSGKTFVVRQVMKELDLEPVFVARRRIPLYYQDLSGLVPIFLLGGYDSGKPSGGCDNIGSAREIFEVIQQIPTRSHILAEGLLLSEDTKWSLQLPDLKVLFLVTPLEQCLSQIKQRRQSVGNDKPLSPDNTRRRVATIERARLKLIEQGTICRRCTAAQSPSIILKWLGRSECSPQENTAQSG